MAWIESHQEIGRHPKTKKFARFLKINLPTAIGHLHLLWWWALDFAQDGDLNRYDPHDISDAMQWDGDENELIEALVSAGFIDDTEEGKKLHDWGVYAGKLIEKKAKDRERKRSTRTDSDGVPMDVRRTSDGNPQESDGNPSLPNLTLPNLTINNNTESKNEICETSATPFEKIRLLWNDICLSFSKVHGINGKRQTAVAARWHDHPDLEWWATYFTRIESSDFLKGKNKRGWRASFDWVMNAANMDKILEGTYDPKEGGAPNGSQTQPANYCQGFKAAEDDCDL